MEDQILTLREYAAYLNWQENRIQISEARKGSGPSFKVGGMAV